MTPLSYATAEPQPHQSATQQLCHTPMHTKIPPNDEIKIQKALRDLESGKIPFIREAA